MPPQLIFSDIYKSKITGSNAIHMFTLEEGGGKIKGGQRNAHSYKRRHAGVRIAPESVFVIFESNIVFLF